MNYRGVLSKLPRRMCTLSKKVKVMAYSPLIGGRSDKLGIPLCITIN